MLRVFATLVLVMSFSVLCVAEEKMVPLKTEIPEEILAGTPPDVLALLFPGLEKLQEGERPEFLVPEGTVNVALKKKVTSSDANPVLGELTFVTDGNKEGSEESYVELGPLQQWVQIDLGQECQIQALFVWHYFREARSYNDVVIQVADDPDFKTNVQTIYNNDQDNSSKLGLGKSRPYIETFQGRLFKAKGEKARYVRLNSNGNTANDLNHYVEVEVFGKPVE